MRQLGNKKWTEKEDAILQDNIGFCSPEDISLTLKRHGFNRTPVAIKVRCKVLKMSYAREFDNISLSRIANLLGVSRTTTSGWYKTGKLKGKREKEKGLVSVKYEDVKKFLVKYINEVKTTLNSDGLNFFLGE